MGEKPIKRDLWIFAILLMAFLTSFLLAAPLMFQGEVLAYFGSVGGSALGGAMTVFAGWLAWQVGQGQLEKQQITLNLVLSEQRQRTQHAVATTLAAIRLFHIEVVHLANFMRKLSLENETPYSPVMLPRVQGIGNLLEEPDVWRLPDDITTRLRDLQLTTRVLNRAIPQSIVPATQELDMRTISDLIEATLLPELQGLQTELSAMLGNLGGPKESSVRS